MNCDKGTMQPEERAIGIQQARQVHKLLRPGHSHHDVTASFVLAVLALSSTIRARKSSGLSDVQGLHREIVTCEMHCQDK